MASNSSLTGVGSPLGYQGVASPQPSNFVSYNRAPVSGTAGKDIKNFKLGDIWLDISQATPIPYILVDMAANIPTWSSFANGGGGASDFVTDSGTATEVGGSLNVLGGELLNTTGSGDTVTIDLDRGTDGQIIIAATGAPSAYGSLTSTGGTITVTGGANALNVEAAAAVPTSFATDSGTAIPAANVLTVAGGVNCSTSGSGSTLTIDVDLDVASVYHTDSGDATPSSSAITVAGGTGIATTGAGSTITINADATIPLSFPADSGTATPALNALTIAGGTGIGTVGAGATLTVNADATVPLSFPADSGTATPSANALTVAGGTGISTSGSGATLTINAEAAIPLSFPTDSGTATPAANALTIAGSGGITTSGSGSTVTIDGSGIGGSGSWILLETKTASAVQHIDFTSNIDSTYEIYLFVLRNITVSTNGSALSMQLSTDGGSNFIAGTGYNWGYHRIFGVNGGVSQSDNLIDTNQFNLSHRTQGLSATIPSQYEIWFDNLNNGGTITYRGYGATAISTYLTVCSVEVCGVQSSVTAANAIKFQSTGGTTFSGIISLYGLKQS